MYKDLYVHSINLFSLLFRIPYQFTDRVSMLKDSKNSWPKKYLRRYLHVSIFIPYEFISEFKYLYTVEFVSRWIWSTFKSMLPLYYMSLKQMFSVKVCLFYICWNELLHLVMQVSSENVLLCDYLIRELFDGKIMLIISKINQFYVMVKNIFQ